MKQVIWVFLSAIMLFSSFAQPAVFAAYGGWGWWSSISKSSTSMLLTRDVCPDGDKSASYYDGTCLSANTDTTTTEEQSTEEHTTATTPEEIVSEEEIKELLTKQKDVEEQIMKLKKKLPLVQKMKLTKIEKKVDSLLARWNMIDEVTRTNKVLLLNTKIDKFLSMHADAPTLLLSVVFYIKQESYTLITPSMTIVR